MSARANQLLEAGLWLKMSGDLEGARRLFEQALKLDPDSIRARELLGHSVPEADAVPQELRDVPVTRTDLFSVPLPRLFQDDAPAPASVPEEWWNAPPSDGMGNTARFFVRPSAAAAPAEAAAPTNTLPWGPSPLSPRTPPGGGPAGMAAGAGGGEEFQGDDLGQSGDDFGLELSEGTPAPLSRSGPKPLPILSPAELLSPAAATSSPTTGAIPLPPEPDARSPVPGPPPGLFQEKTVVTGPPRVTGGTPLAPAVAGAHSPIPGPVAGTPQPRPATTGAIPLPPISLPPMGTPPSILSLAAASPVSAAPRGAPTLETHVVVPLPPGKQPPSGGLPPEPAPSLEPLPWAMPVSPSAEPPATPSRGPVPLPGGRGTVLSPPRGPSTPPAVSPFPPPPTGRRELPSDAWGGEGDGPTLLAPEGPAAALELLAEPRTVSGLTPLPAPRDPRSEAARMFERARELQNLDDHSGARELLLQAQALCPDLTGLADALARSETKLQTIYESKIGKLSAVPRVRLKEDEVIWLNLDHRAGFMLAQIDGTLSFEDLFSVSGMSRLDTARILAQLLDQRVIVS